MRVYVMHDGTGIQPGIYIEFPMAYFQEPQERGCRYVKITEKTDMGEMARIIRDSIYIVGYDRPTGGRRTRIIIPTSHIVSIQFPEASE